jgi:Protein of unknown function, DUF547
LFVNLYHCLLQHALLLAVNGPLHRRTVGNFMRASCYEIGGDVFSLAELQSCIIRGNMSRPVSPKPPYVSAPKKSNAYRFYALNYTDPRVNFVLVSYCRSAPGRETCTLSVMLIFLPFADRCIEHWRCLLSSGRACFATRTTRRTIEHSLRGVFGISTLRRRDPPMCFAPQSVRGVQE